jgi:hypothetical protein
MQPCAAQLCTLRPEIVNLDPADQAAMILACKIADATAFAKCAEKQRTLTEWVRKQ